MHDELIGSSSRFCRRNIIQHVFCMKSNACDIPRKCQHLRHISQSESPAVSSGEHAANTTIGILRLIATYIRTSTDNSPVKLCVVFESMVKTEALFVVDTAEIGGQLGWFTSYPLTTFSGRLKSVFKAWITSNFLHYWIFSCVTIMLVLCQLICPSYITVIRFTENIEKHRTTHWIDHTLYRLICQCILSVFLISTN